MPASSPSLLGLGDGTASISLIARKSSGVGLPRWCQTCPLWSPTGLMATAGSSGESTGGRIALDLGSTPASGKYSETLN